MNVKSTAEKLAYAEGQVRNILASARELQATLPPIRVDVHKRTGGHLTYERANTALETAVAKLITDAEVALAGQDLDALKRVIKRQKYITAYLSGPGSKFMLASAEVYGTSAMTLYTICGASLTGLTLLCHPDKVMSLLDERDHRPATIAEAVEA